MDFLAAVVVLLNAVLGPPTDAFYPDDERVIFIDTGGDPTTDTTRDKHNLTIAAQCASMAGVRFDGIWPGPETTEETDRILRELAALLVDKRKNEGMPPRRYNLRSYFLQVCPIVSAGKKLIFIVGFHASIMPNRDRYRVSDSVGWRYKLIEPKHWKSRRFQVTYDITTRTLENFTFDK